MLSISDNTVEIDTSKYKSFSKVELSRANIFFKRFVIVFFICLLIILFLPWTQNVRAKGKVTTLTPDQRPQTIHATIAGRVEKWYVREGQLVKKGDTIVYLSEIKSEYFDPELLPRTQAQVSAKESSVVSYSGKVGALEDQIVAMRGELKFKKEQLTNKIEQTKLKAEAERNAAKAAEIDVETEKIQLVRTEELFKQGLKSRTEIENKRLKLQQTQAKYVESQNKYQQSLQEIENLRSQLRGADSEYEGKIAKAESDKFSTISDKLDAQANVNKLKNQYSNYEKRASFYYITAPQDCYITKATTVGIGETVKEGEPIVSTVPANMNLAVEMYIAPIDLPLMRIGSPVRFLFDGWPAFIFSGWPQASIGTYSGKVWAIDNVANEAGQYRLIVAPDPEQPKWPDALRPGSGARGFSLLNDVPVWYELWRQLNGFPPDFYKKEDNGNDSKEKKKG
jgi:membrane fusion protein, adhesin transport system